MEEVKLKLERRRRALARLKQPIITTKMRFGGLKTRTQRQEIVRHRREIESQKRSYTKDIRKVEQYLKAKKEFEELEPIENGPIAPIAPEVSLFTLPRCRRIRRENKLSHMRRYH